MFFSSKKNTVPVVGCVMSGKIYSGVHWQIAVKLVPPKGLENPSLGTPLQVHKESICIKQPNESNLFHLYMNNVTIDNLLCFRFEKKKSKAS